MIFMRTAGIISEYNPFHRGHAWQLGELRRRLGADTAVVCAMSGNFVQRGDFAILRAHARAEAAVRGGADLVLELPLPWAIASAEGFAAGGVGVLAATGADVYIVYRRGMEELPARHEEVEHAEEEGIIFKTLTNPIKINGNENGYVASMTCVEMELGEPDASGRRRPIEKVGSDFDLPVDCVIMSLGTTPNPLIKNTTPGLEVNRKGGIVVNEEGLTSHASVYAGGDAVTGAATVILAMGAGKLGAKSIDEQLSKK